MQNRTTYKLTGDLRPFDTTRDLSYRAPTLRLAAGKIARGMSRGFGWCSCCGRPWTITKGASVFVSDEGYGASPLCDDCFMEMTPTERLPHFLALFQDWQMSDELNGREFIRGLECYEKGRPSKLDHILPKWTNKMDYQAKILDLQGAIRIKTSARRSTAVLVHKLSQVRTLQIKQEMRDEKKRAKLAR